MTESELKLCCAILRARLGSGDRPTTEKRHHAAIAAFAEWVLMTGDSYFPFSIDDVTSWVLAFRKNKDTQVKVEVAIAKGTTCYFKSCGKGPCSEDIEAGHIVPKSKGGLFTVENLQIECHSHNNQRGVMSIEDYISSGLTTETSNSNGLYEQLQGRD